MQRSFLTSVLILGGLAGGAVGAELVDVIVRGGAIVTMDAERRVIERGAVAVRGAKIAAVGPEDDILARFESPQTIDARGRVVVPGLVNTHGHAAMTLFRGLADDLALMEWLRGYIFP